MLIIGESLNGHIPPVGKAIKARDEDYLVRLAREQVERGADYLDVCASIAKGDQAEHLTWMAQVVQGVTDKPLVLDSDDSAALEAAVRACHGPVVLSSITAEEERMKRLIPLAVETGSDLVGLCMGSDGIPKSAEGRLKVALEIVEAAGEAGIARERLWLDPMVISIGTDDQAGRVTLETVRALREELPEVHIMGGVSNVGFGLPNRRALNRAFVPMLIGAGMDGFMVDVRDAQLMTMLHAARALAGQDRYCQKYLKAYRAGDLV